MRHLASAILLLVLLLGSLVVIPSASALSIFDTITFDAAATTGASGTTFTWTHTTTGRPNRLLLVGLDICRTSSFNIDSVTYGPGAVALTRLRRDTAIPPIAAGCSSHELQIWSLTGPSIGSGTVTVNADSSVNLDGISLTFYNVDQAAPISGGGAFECSPTSAGPCSGIGGDDVFSFAMTPTTANNLVVDFADALAATSLTADAGQTERAESNFAVSFFKASTEPAQVTSTTVGWSTDAVRWNHVAVIVLASSTPVGDDGGIVGGPSFDFPTNAKPFCPSLGPVDWILPTTQPGSLNVTIEDQRREAALVTQYIINWGDGNGSIAPMTPMSHTYAKPDIYTITMRVQYRSGAIEIFSSFIDLRGNNCALSAFVTEFFPILGLLGGLTAVGAFIVTLSQRKKAVLKVLRLRRWLLIVTVIAFGIIIAVAIYMAAAGIPFT